MVLLQLQNLVRRTLKKQESLGAFPTRQFWHEPRTLTYWWDLEAVLQHLRLTEKKAQKRNHWLQVVSDRAAKDLVNDPPYLHTPSQGDAVGVPCPCLITFIMYPHNGIGPNRFICRCWVVKALATNKLSRIVILIKALRVC